MSSENYRVEKQDAVYFLTFTVTDWVDVFTRLNYRIIIAESLDFCRKNKELKLYAWCLMTNHIHLVCSIEPPFTMTDFLRDYKKFTAKAVLDDIKTLPESRRDWMLYRFEFAGKFDNRIEKYRFWQDKSHPVELTTTEMIDQRISYIHENPVRAGLPLESYTGDNPEEQNKKYNGKEFIEMHGLDEYDSQARWYYPAILRTTTIDPLCEKYYSISPYAWCLNNPINSIDPDGRLVVATSIDAQRMILNTLPKDIRQYVSFDKNGYVNQDGLKNVESNSGNFNSLRTMALSDKTIEVKLDNKFDYSDKEGNTQTQSMTYLGVDKEFIGNDNGKGVGTSTGETGFLGKTLFPDNNGLQNSTNGNTVVVVNSSLSEEGRAETYSHEANGHAYMYNVTNGDRSKASHDFAPGNKDLNIDLFKLINKAINETIQNMK